MHQLATVIRGPFVSPSLDIPSVSVILHVGHMFIHCQPASWPGRSGPGKLASCLMSPDCTPRRNGKLLFYEIEIRSRQHSLLKQRARTLADTDTRTDSWNEI